MKKLLIYSRNQNRKNILLRAVRISDSFVGIGKNGQIIDSEFKKLSLDLEPSATSHEVINL